MGNRKGIILASLVFSIVAGSLIADICRLGF